MKKISIKDRAMAALNSKSEVPDSDSLSTESTVTLPHLKPSASSTRNTTGPGGMASYVMRESETFNENQQLKEELKTWDGALPTKRLNPNEVLHSRWANRHDDSFLDPEFEEFKAEIQSAGGNIQPIKVRPLPGTDPLRYEIVFGHRRHRACQDLGLNVLALVESITDKSLFEEMDRENRQRSDLRPYEQGVMYRRALDEGLYPSLRKLAEALGVAASNVSRSIALAELPEVVLNAFLSRLDIQYRWSSKLVDALDKDNKGVLTRAQSIIEDRKNGVEVSSDEAFHRIIGAHTNDTIGDRQIEVNGKAVASIKVVGGRCSVRFEKGVLTGKQIEMLEQTIEKMLKTGSSKTDR